MKSSSSTISDYALLSGVGTAALVSRSGSIDWYCWPRFDSPAQLCRLIDPARGGFLSVAPASRFVSQRRYARDTNVLETQFTASSGRLQVTDLLPLPPRSISTDGVWGQGLLRKLECLEGEIDVDILFKPTFDYARASVEWLGRPDGVVATNRADPSQRLALFLSHDSKCVLQSGVAAYRIRLAEGEVVWVVLSAGEAKDSTTLRAPEVALELALQETLHQWREWVGRLRYTGRYRDAVVRSALVLKGLTFNPTGAVVAAPSCSLPEWIGGVRNWDYRYVWMRDASLVLHTLISLGIHDEAMQFWTFVQDLASRDVPLRVMYRVDGSPDLPEERLDHLSGHRGSRPVRIGNAAAQQRQSDIYGHLLDAATECRRSMPTMDEPAFLAMVTRLATCAREVCRLPDQGIWEVRGPPQHFVHSKLMCWVAFERATELARLRGDFPEATRWSTEADELRSLILEQGYRTDRGAFVQSFGSTALDASLLVLPLVGFLPARDPRVLSTVQRIQEELSWEGFVRRYRVGDGLPGAEGALLLCSFWLVDNLALQGRLEEARAMLQRLLDCANDVGLLSEEFEPVSGELLGNFPQAFSHLALIQSAILIERVERDPPLTPSLQQPS